MFTANGLATPSPVGKISKRKRAFVEEPLEAAEEHELSLIDRESLRFASPGKKQKAALFGLELATVNQDLPFVDVKSFHSEALLLKQKTLNAIPYSKNGSGRDAYTFYRLQPHLEELQFRLTHFMGIISSKALNYHQFTVNYNEDEEDQSSPESGKDIIDCWKVCFKEIQFMVDWILPDLPEFDDQAHNEYRREILARIASLYVQIISNFDVTALVPKNAEYLECAANSLKKLAAISPEQFHHVIEGFQKRLGWIS
ncbi:hypothetical protein MP638_006509 [Amoeboaphelidium occidentale]|nr:hypothetical protein MP638_006509 [Amoeboaphelidium occidentale]